MGYSIVPGSGARQDFLEGLAGRLGARTVRVARKRFPDGETYVRIEEALEGVPVVVQSMYPGQNDRLVELLLLIEAVQGLTGEPPVLVVPYLAYARQDRRFLEGEPVSIRAVLAAIEATGGGPLVVVDAHKPEALSAYKPGYLNVLPAPVFAETLRRRLGGGENVVIVAPDRGALGRARAVAELLGARYDYLVKERDHVTGEVKYYPREVEVKDSVVVLVDDIVSTGGTMAKAAEMLYGMGAARVIAMCSHGLFVGNALEKMRRAGIKDIMAANTVPLPEGVEPIDVSGLVAEKVEEAVREKK